MGTQTSQLIKPEFSPLSLTRALWKQRFIVSVIAIGISVASVGVVFSLRPVYRADAVIVVDSQKVPEKYVQSTVSTDVDDRLSSVTQEILNSRQLTSMINEFHLYERERKKRTEEEVFAIMRKDVSVKAEKGSGRGGAYRVSYEAPSGIIAAGVANRVAGLFIEQNLKNRAIHSEGTLQFLDAQLQSAKKILDDLEIAVSQYKLQHNGELPQQEGALLSTLNRLQTELQGNQDAINRAHQSKMTAENALGVSEGSVAALSAAAAALAQASALASAQAGIAAPGPSTGVEHNVPALMPRRRQSDDMQAQLSALLFRGYSDDHPDVKRLKLQLATVLKREEKEAREMEAAGVAAEQQAQSAEPEAGRQHSAAVAPPRREILPPSPDLLLARERRSVLQSQLTTANEEIGARTTERKRIIRDIDAQEKRLENLPVREQQMAGLTRDYNISKLNYTNLLDKKIEAARAADLERRQQGERFTLIEPATVPFRPYKPNRLIFSLGACMFGLGVAAVIGLGKELKSSTLLGEWELPPGTIILGRVPPIYFSATQSPKPEGKGGSPRPVRFRRLTFAASGLALLLCLAVAVFAALKGF